MVECRAEVLESRSVKIQGKRRQMVQMGCELRGCENAWCFVLNVSQYEFIIEEKHRGVCNADVSTQAESHNDACYHSNAVK